MSITIYESYNQENLQASTFNQPYIRSILSSQLTADVFPFSFVEHDTYHETKDFGHDQGVSHSIFCWDFKAPELDINLFPLFKIDKAVFVLVRYTELISFHELHLRCSSYPL